MSSTERDAAGDNVDEQIANFNVEAETASLRRSLSRAGSSAVLLPTSPGPNAGEAAAMLTAGSFEASTRSTNNIGSGGTPFSPGLANSLDSIGSAGGSELEALRPMSASNRPMSASSRHGANEEVEKRLNAMRERFRMLQLMEEMEKEKGIGDDGDSIKSPARPPGLGLAGSPGLSTPSTQGIASPANARWGKLRKVVNSKAHFVNWADSSLPILMNKSFKGGAGATGAAESKGSAVADSTFGVEDEEDENNTTENGKQQTAGEEPIEIEDVRLMEFWKSLDESKTLDSLKAATDRTREATGGGEAVDGEAGQALEPSEEVKREPELVLPSADDGQQVESDFEAKAEILGVTVNRIPEEVVIERKARIEKEIREEQQKVIDRIRAKEADVLYREEDARSRLKEQENQTRKRYEAEKQKVAQLALEKERALGKDFRRLRERLEDGIKRQQGAVEEKFGKLLVHEESLARRFSASTNMSPQPIEMRIHMMRAVKTKLPKGAYVLMLTQFDSLGGRPLSWSRIGSNGIGDLRPGISHIFKHYGRYFDRILRVEDSVFALCPPKPLMKPNYVFVLELFQLSSRTNPFDKIVGWTALPMVYESMTLVEGKVKLPLLHGEHSPNIQLFKDMEKSMAEDITNWLANIYIEIRHMSLSELGATEEMLKTTDFDLDYFNKSMMPKVEPQAPATADTGDNDIETGASGGARAATSIEHDHDHKQDQESDAYSFQNGSMSSDPATRASLLLPVDKGIFRRKLTSNAADAVGGMGNDAALGVGANADGDASAISGPGFTINTNPSNLGSMFPTNKDHNSDEDEQAPLLQRKKIAAAPPPGPLSRQNSSKRMLATVGGHSVLSGVTSVLSRRSEASKPLLLKNDDNFVAHRKELVRRWKENAHSKMAAAGELDDELFDEVRERGYHVADEMYLHREQRGKLAGVEAADDRKDRQWAQVGLEGKIVRRFQSEGPRFDSEAIFDPNTFNNNQLQASPRRRMIAAMAAGGGADAGAESGGFGANGGDVSVAGGVGDNSGRAAGGAAVGTGKFNFNIHAGWEELRDVREMEDYSMAVAADPNNRKRLMPGAKARSKMRYIIYEMFGDFTYYLWGTFEFYMAILMYIFCLWIRIYVHYMAQYLYLLSLGTPVFDFELRALEIQQKYMSDSISVAAEVGVVAIGPIACVCVFLALVIFGTMFYKIVGYMPEVFSKFFAAFGLAAIFDPLLVVVIDLIFHNYDCENKNKECEEDYTSGKCNCFNGDFIKLWYRMDEEEGSGLSGLFIMILLYMGTGILATLILYYYIVYIHRDGKVLDQWRRINGAPSEFFIPLDFEVSSDELKETIDKASRWRGPRGARRRLQVHTFEHFDGLSKRYVINEVEAGGVSSIFRQFQMEPSGVIVELFEDTKSSLQQARKGIFFDDAPPPPRPVSAEAFRASVEKLAAANEGTIAQPPAGKTLDGGTTTPPGTGTTPMVQGSGRFARISNTNDEDSRVLWDASATVVSNTAAEGSPATAAPVSTGAEPVFSPLGQLSDGGRQGNFEG